MSVESILGSAVVAAVVSAVAGIFTKMLIDTRLESTRSELNQRLEALKSELSVWAKFRNDTLQDMWKAYRGVAGAMTAVILQTQQLSSSNTSLTALAPAIDEYRRAVHSSIDLLSPKALGICQRFLETAYEIRFERQEPQDANPLKTCRHDLTEYMVAHFRLEEVLPWMSAQGERP